MMFFGLGEVSQADLLLSSRLFDLQDGVVVNCGVDGFGELLLATCAESSNWVRVEKRWS